MGKYFKVLFLLFLLPVAVYTQEKSNSYDSEDEESIYNYKIEVSEYFVDWSYNHVIFFEKNHSKYWEFYLYPDTKKAILHNLDTTEGYSHFNVADRSILIVPKEIDVEGEKYAVEEINENAFRVTIFDKPSVVLIPNSINYVRNQAFGWFRTNYVNFQNGGEELNTGILVFQHANIMHFVLPDRWKHIRWGAFYDCTILKSFYVPGELESIDETAFTGCDNLKDIYIFKDKLPAVVRENPEPDVEVLDSIGNKYDYDYVYASSYYNLEAWDPKNATLHVPSGMVETFKNAYFWNRFKDVVAITEEEMLGIGGLEESQTEISSVYTTSGVKTDRMHKGVNIVRMSDGTVRKVMKR